MYSGNNLPTDVTQPDLSYFRFRQSLKTFIFLQWDQTHCAAHPFYLHWENTLIYLLT